MIRSRWLVVLASCLIVTAVNAQPKMSVEGGTKFDMGTVDRGKAGQKKLTLRNTGSDTLILGQVEVSCGCTGTMVSSSRIAPGKTGELLITFNTGGYVGEVHKNVTVNSNDVASPKTLIEFTATVIEEVVVNPRQLYFRTAEVGKVDTFSIAVTNTGKEPFSVTGYQCSLASLTLDVPKEPVKPGETIRVKGQLNPKEPKGILTDNLNLQTSSKRQPGIDIAIFGAIKEFKFK